MFDKTERQIDSNWEVTSNVSSVSGYRSAVLHGNRHC